MMWEKDEMAEIRGVARISIKGGEKRRKRAPQGARKISTRKATSTT